MTQRLKAAARALLPDRVLRGAYAAQARRQQRERVRAAERAFASAPAEPRWLGSEALAALQQRYTHPPKYGYDPDSLRRRGEERARTLVALTGARDQEPRSYLELGCWDGMVGYGLRRRGRAAVGIDQRAASFDRRSIEAGAHLVQMDAARVGCCDERFDVVFSYDAMEHFADPEAVMREAVRLVRTGGLIYLFFGPLYMAPYGLHAYRSITVPYCQFLFPEDVLRDFCTENGLADIDFGQVNGWSLGAFRRLWKDSAPWLRVVSYSERKSLAHVDLIARYPSCFRGKVSSFEDFLVEYVEVLFRKERKPTLL